MLKRIALGMVLLAGLMVGRAWAEQAPLFDAVSKGDLGGIKALIDKGADVNAKDGDGSRPLHYAIIEAWSAGATSASSTYKDVVELLLARGADVNAKGYLGSTPLHYAARKGLKSIVELLIAKGADVNAKNDDGITPLQDAEDKDVIAVLIAHGARR